jgi:nitrogen fixation/metabolism regulation signal transduction histidine kinase
LGNKPYKRKLSNYLLDKGLQLRYILFVTMVSAVICGSLGYLIYQQEVDASETIRNMTGSFDSDLQHEVSAHLESDDTNLVLTMVGIGIGLVIVLSLYLLVMTHKVAGPLYKVTLYFDKMKEGRLDTVWPLRKGDQLQSFYEKFHNMHLAVKERHVEVNDKLKRFVELADRDVGEGGESGHRLQELRSHCEERDKALAS